MPKNESEKYAYKSIHKTPVKENYEYHDYLDENSQSNLKEEQETVNKNTDAETEKEQHEEKKTEDEEYYDDYEEEERIQGETNHSEKPTTTTRTITTTTTTSTTQTPIEEIQQPLIRLVKRPFLPSRGGNPYSSRSLNPVGAQAPSIVDDVVGNDESIGSKQVSKQPAQEAVHFKPSAMILKSPTTVFTSDGGVQEEFQPQSDPRLMITPPQKEPEKNPPNLKEQDYDVTLNDALDPTMASLPNKGYNDYTYANYRPYYGQDQAASSVVADFSNRARAQGNRDQSLPRTSDLHGHYRLYENQKHQQSQPFYTRY